MGGKILIAAVLCMAGMLIQAFGQIVEIPRDESTKTAQSFSDEHAAAEAPVRQIEPGQFQRPEPSPEKPTVEQMRQAGALAAQRMKKESPDTRSHLPAVATRSVSKIEAAPRFSAYQFPDPEPRQVEPVHLPSEMAFIKLADGFDFPVGKPEAQGYYKAQGFHANGHLGEDWDGIGGGDTDLGDPIYSIGDGVVVFARDCHMGWGNVVIVRHAYREDGSIRNIDSLYAHLEKILVRRGQAVRRGEQIATLGNAHGLYDAHLHFEIRKNLEIGMSRAKFAKDFSNYFEPSRFIMEHRQLQGGGRNYRIALNTFTRDARIRWDRLPNYSHAHTGGGSRQSAAALKRALASENAIPR